MRGVRRIATTLVLLLSGCAQARCVIPYAIGTAALGGVTTVLATNIGMAKAEAEHQLGPKPSGSNTQLWQVPVAVGAGAITGTMAGLYLCTEP